MSSTPISVQQQMKKMPPPNALPQLRVLSNSAVRPAIIATQSSPPSSVIPQKHYIPTPSNGINRPALNMPHIDVVKPDMPNQNQPALNGVAHLPQTHPSQDPSVNGTGGPQNNDQFQVPSSYHLTQMSNLATHAALTNNPNYQTHNNPPSLTAQQVQTITSAFANRELAQQLRALPNYQYHNLQELNATGIMNQKLPANRQWTGGAGQKVEPVVNGIDVQG